MADAKKVIDITGKELLMVSLAFGFGDGPRETKASESGKTEWYRAMVYNGVVFTMPENKYKQWEAGDLHTIRVLSFDETIKDDATGQDTTIARLSFQNAFTFNQYNNLRDAEVRDEFRKDFVKADLAAKLKGIDVAALSS